MEQGYVLEPRAKQEIKRLRSQHEVWRRETQHWFGKAGLLDADRVLELGCGPGFSVMDLCKGPASKIVGVDSSAVFIDHLKNWKAANYADQVEAVLADINEVELRTEQYDACFCRWVLMFNSRIIELMEKVFHALAPGGVFAIMEYGPFKDISIDPPATEFNRIYDAVYRLLKKWGGDPDVGLAAPELLRSCGFVDVKLDQVSKAGKPGSALWEWILATGDNHSNLVENELISEEELVAYYELMQQRGAEGSTIFTSPTVQQIVAYKPR